MRGFLQLFCESHFGIAAEQIIQFHDRQHSVDVHQLGLIVYYSFCHLKASWHHWPPPSCNSLGHANMAYGR